ncbi:hypothetical protein T484DRAFT_1786216 [Baffinella frigidus]|nr:hypothetical protein T484DRAFT_1786216 [Cryptophyta sp. CCMP2293]
MHHQRSPPRRSPLDSWEEAGEEDPGEQGEEKRIQGLEEQRAARMHNLFVPRNRAPEDEATPAPLAVDGPAAGAAGDRQKLGGGDRPASGGKSGGGESEGDLLEKITMLEKSVQVEP